MYHLIPLVHTIATVMILYCWQLYFLGYGHMRGCLEASLLENHMTFMIVEGGGACIYVCMYACAQISTLSRPFQQLSTYAQQSLPYCEAIGDRPNIAHTHTHTHTHTHNILGENCMHYHYYEIEWVFLNIRNYS